MENFTWTELVEWAEVRNNKSWNSAHVLEGDFILMEVLWLGISHLQC